MKGRVLTFILRFLCATARVKVEGLGILKELGGGKKGIVYCLWHGKMLFPFYYFRNKGIKPIISRHRDGELLASIAERLGYRPIRGSSTRFGGAALFEALKCIEKGEDVVFAGDGPLGPYHKLKVGCVYAASKTGAPLFIGSYASKPKKNFKSWDKFLIFPPFSKVKMKIRGPYFIPSIQKEELEEWRLKIEEELDRLDKELEKEIKGG